MRLISLSRVSTPFAVQSSLKTERKLVMWNDIDLYHAFRDFTTDPVSFPIDDVKALIDNLVRIVLRDLRVFTQANRPLDGQ